MLRHGESPEKPKYGNHLFLDNPPISHYSLPPPPFFFSRKNFQTLSISTNFEKAELRQLYEEEGAGSNYARSAILS